MQHRRQGLDPLRQKSGGSICTDPQSMGRGEAGASPASDGAGVLLQDTSSWASLLCSYSALRTSRLGTNEREAMVSASRASSCVGFTLVDMCWLVVVRFGDAVTYDCLFPSGTLSPWSESPEGPGKGRPCFFQGRR